MKCLIYGSPALAVVAVMVSIAAVCVKHCGPVPTAESIEATDPHNDAGPTDLSQYLYPAPRYDSPRDVEFVGDAYRRATFTRPMCIRYRNGPWYMVGGVVPGGCEDEE